MLHGQKGKTISATIREFKHFPGLLVLFVMGFHKFVHAYFLQCAVAINFILKCKPYCPGLIAMQHFASINIKTGEI